MKPTIQDVEIIARQAGAILQAGFGQQIQIDHKGEIDLVTEYDHKSEQFILETIRNRFPDHSYVAEESGVQKGSAGGTWYIDPLDGTVNYAHGVPFYCVSIAFAENGLVELGVVFDPVHDECYKAIRSKGAWLNSIPLHVASTQELDQSLLVTGFPYNVRDIPQNNLDNYASFALKSLGVRRLGSAALDLCYVAAGRFDGYWEVAIEAWDIAAGGLIAQEAGAKVTSISGSLDYLKGPPSVLAANPVVHAQMLSVLNGKND